MTGASVEVPKNILRQIAQGVGLEYGEDVCDILGNGREVPLPKCRRHVAQKLLKLGYKINPIGRAIGVKMSSARYLIDATYRKQHKDRMSKIYHDKNKT